MTNPVSRRDFLSSSALIAASVAAPLDNFTGIAQMKYAPRPIQLGLASYTFRNFNRAQLINFMKQLNLSAINLKDVKDHLPMPAQQESAALSDYAAAGIKPHAAGTVYFDKDEDADIRNKFEYAKRSGISVIVAGDPALATLPRIETFVREYNIKFAIHNHGPEDKLWHSPVDVLKAVKDLDQRIGCCIDVGHTVRAGTDVVQAIHAAGPRLFNIHMKDLANFQEKDSQVAVGAGKMPVPQIFQALTAINYQGFVDLEYEIYPDDPLPGAIASFAYMRNVAASLAAASS